MELQANSVPARPCQELTKTAETSDDEHGVHASGNQEDLPAYTEFAYELWIAPHGMVREVEFKLAKNAIHLPERDKDSKARARDLHQTYSQLLLFSCNERARRRQRCDLSFGA